MTCNSFGWYIYTETPVTQAFNDKHHFNSSEIKDLNHFSDHLDMEIKEYFRRAIA